MKKEETPKFIPNRDYKYDRAMHDAAKRAQFQPKLATVSSNVRETKK